MTHDELKDKVAKREKVLPRKAKDRREHLLKIVGSKGITVGKPQSS